MPRPRKSRLMPSLQAVAQELLHHLSQSIAEVARAECARFRDEIRGLRKELSSLQRRVSRAQAGGRVGRPRSNRSCSIPACAQAHVARGLCKNHYQQMRYVEKKGASGQTVRRRRASGALAPILEVAKAHGLEVQVPMTLHASTSRRNGASDASGSFVAEG